MTRVTETVTLERHQNIGVIVVDNPPVNAIAPSVRAGIDQGAIIFSSEPAIDAIVLHCAGRNFMAGADLRVLATGAKPSKSGTDVMLGLENLKKPVVAALQGNALGGGLEFALACHYRIATRNARLGLPEVNLGLIPGACGTQRLPRLIGVAKAVDMIAGGVTIGVPEALAAGLVDRVAADDDVLAAAVGYARELLANKAPLRRTRELPIANSAENQATLAAAEKSFAKSRKGELAPLQAIAAVRGALTLPFAEGVALQAELFAQCRQSPQARALQHLFFAERQVGKLAGVAAGTRPRVVDKAGVLGGGTMGRGIAMSFANAGFDVVLVETDAAALHKALSQIESTYRASVAKGRMTAAEQNARQQRIRGSTEQNDFRDLDIVIEAVYEDMALKQKIFLDLDGICRPGAILATNTSALDIDAIAGATSRPQDVLGLHFFSPAHVMRLVEVVRGAKTSPEALVSAMAMVKAIRKIGVLAGNCDGFVGNRMLAGYRRESELLVLEGASPQQVDQALVEFGMSMGPHAMGDMAGLDVGAAGRKRRRAEGRLPQDERFAVIADRLVAEGRFGQKTGAGMYRYEKGSHQPLPDPAVDAMIVAEARRLNVTRRPVSDAEIVARCIYPLINEGARILDEGVAQRPGDIDVIWTNGYGFPRARGGPMKFADEVGLDQVLTTLRHFATEHGPLYWQPAPLLERLVAEGRNFASLNV
jgi:3-hydroxyacyl-CoA dehydrogenase